MSKYIKRINWPWVEIEDLYNGTILVNVNEISAVWENAETIYKHGIRFKDGSWSELCKKDALVELKDLIMNHQTNQSRVGSLYGIVDPELLSENQSLYEWLNENNQV